ncbi:MAG: hypothetical protein AAB370_05880 [Verrucomicrobiota bacterium]
MKQGLTSLIALLLLTGCATSTIESRRRERADGFAALSPEFKTLVNEGQIRRGMTPDAVYIAWGKPAQVLQREDPQGVVLIWLYHGGWLEETRYWTHTSRVPISDYQPRTYVSAEINFVDGVVQSWRTLPKPTY